MGTDRSGSNVAFHMGGTTSNVAAPEWLAGIATRVDARMDELLAAEVARWSAVDPDLADPLEGLRQLVVAGGKRLRPAFCHWGHVAGGGDPDDPRVVDVGAALELLHTFALVHDDVMDNSIRRRGRTTVHVRFAERHAVDAWRGEGRRFGEGVAILVGDLAFVYADILLGDVPPAAARVFDELRLEVNVGQYLDLLNTVRGGTDRDRARRISQYKSGKYTVERPLHLGAALAGRFDDLAGVFTEYGMRVGEAFQLRDDLLGAFGDADVTGKPVGEDIREGKPTLLRAVAAERADAAGVRLLERAGAPDLDDDEVAAIQRVLVDTGAGDEVESAIGRLVDEAVALLEGADIVPVARDALETLARYATARDR